MWAGIIAMMLMGFGLIFAIIADPEGETPLPSTSNAVVIDYDAYEWAEYHADALADYEAQFDALFNSYETRWSKNNRLMIRQGNSGSFKFVAKG